MNVENQKAELLNTYQRDNPYRNMKNRLMLSYHLAMQSESFRYNQSFWLE